MSTSQIHGARTILSSSPNSIGQSTRLNDLQLSVLAKSSHVICTFTTPMRKTNGGTIRVTVFSLTHMPTVSFQEAGERKMASVGQGNKIFSHYVSWNRQNMPCSVCHSRCLSHHLYTQYPNSVIGYLAVLNMLKAPLDFRVCAFD